MFDINELLWCLTSKQPEKKSSSVSSRPTAPLSLNHANAFHLPKSSCFPLRLHIAPLQAQHSACPRQESQLQHQTTFRVLNLFLPTCSTNCTYILKASPGSHLLSTSGVTLTPLSLYPFTPWPEATEMEMQGDVGGSRTLGRTSLPAEQTPLFLWPMKKRAEELLWPTLPLFCPQTPAESAMAGAFPVLLFQPYKPSFPAVGWTMPACSKTTWWQPEPRLEGNI